MKKLIVAVVALAVVAMAGKAMAAGAANMTVNATVQGICGISSTPTINLILDPSSGLLVTGNGDVVFICTNGTPYTVGGEAVGTMTGPGSIDYTLGYVDNGGGTGTGLSQTFTATVTVPYANYATAPAGAYTDTAQVTILP